MTTASEPGATAPRGSAFLELVQVMDRLRSPGGCPWDAAQTHASLVPHLLEEAWEVEESVAAGDSAALREELGDVLLQVVFHARIAQEADPAAGGQPWDVDDVAREITAKLIRRHPHVFAGTTVADAAEVSANWEAIKRREKGRTSAVDGVPMGQPALALYAALLRRAGRHGLLVRDGLGPAVVEAADTATDPADAVTDPAAAARASVGERLAALVAEAVAAGVDPEAELRVQARALATAIREAEGSRGETG